MSPHKWVRAKKDWRYCLNNGDPTVKVLKEGEEREIPVGLARDGFESGHLEVLAGKEVRKAEKGAVKDENKAEKPAAVEKK